MKYKDDSWKKFNNVWCLLPLVFRFVWNSRRVSKRASIRLILHCYTLNAEVLFHNWIPLFSHHTYIQERRRTKIHHIQISRQTIKSFLINKEPRGRFNHTPKLHNRTCNPWKSESPKNGWTTIVGWRRVGRESRRRIVISYSFYGLL